MTIVTGAANQPPDELDRREKDDPNPCVAHWMALEQLARREPSLTVYRPKGEKGRARWERTDRLWRALLAGARGPRQVATDDADHCDAGP